MNRVVLENLVRSLSLGIRTMTVLHDEIKVPNPTLNMLVFHKSQKENYFVTLQAQTSLIEGIITEHEIDWICEILANISKIKEKCFSCLKTFCECTVITISIVLVVMPLIAGTVYGIEGLAVGFLLYFALILFFYLLKKIVYC